jgi:hypothetical protein
MKQLTRSNWPTTAALLLSLPTAYLISISILKYGLGMNGPFDASAPLLENMGIKESLGWNINLLILLGPLTGFFLASLQVLKIKWEFSKEDFQFHFTIRKKWFPILVAAFSASILGVLFLYASGENCNC